MFNLRIFFALAVRRVGISMAKVCDVRLVVLEGRWVSHCEYARILTTSCLCDDAQRRKRLWQYHIESASAFLDHATNTADTSMERICVESFEWQVPSTRTDHEFDFDSDDAWTSEGEGRRALYESQRGPQQFIAYGRCPDCCMRASRAKAGERILKRLRGQGRA